MEIHFSTFAPCRPLPWAATPVLFKNVLFRVFLLSYDMARLPFINCVLFISRPSIRAATPVLITNNVSIPYICAVVRHDKPAFDLLDVFGCRPSTWAAPTGPVDPSVREHRDLRWEQDQAYEESLAADRAKAEAAERAAREAEEAARLEREAAEAAERAAAEEEDRVKKLLETKAARLQPEPAAGTPGVVSVMVRMSDGSRISRRFHQTDALQAVFDFVDVQHQAASIKPETYNLINSWPRKTYKFDAPGTLADAGITSDTALFVEQA